MTSRWKDTRTRAFATGQLTSTGGAAATRELKQALATRAAREFSEAVVYARTHCWQCGRPRMYDDAATPCPHCDAEVTPF